MTSRSRSHLPPALAAFLLTALVGLVGCSAPRPTSDSGVPASKPAAAASAPSSPPTLVPAHMTLVSASAVPANPLTDKSLDQAPLGKAIRWGFRLFTDTRGEAPQFVASRVSCTNCHLNAGQRERA